MKSEFARKVLAGVCFLIWIRSGSAGDISGTVTVQGNGTPLANIDIDVFDSNLLPVATNARSDAMGQYLVTGLAAGNYVIRADPNVGDGYVDEYNGGSFLRSQAPMFAVPGAGAVVVNFALSLGAPMSGRITIQGSGFGAAGVDIDVFTQAGELVDSVNATTDLNGDYAIGSFPPGNYLLRADPDPSTFLIERFYINADSRNTATPISVTGTLPVNGIDIQVPEGGLVRGTVRDANTLIPLSGVDLDTFDSLGVFQRAGAATLASGTYELGPLPPGQYYIRADPLATSFYVPTYHPNSFFESGGTLVTVIVGGITSNVNIDLPRGGNIGGLVSAAVGMAPLPDIDLDVFDTLGARMPVNAKSDLAGVYLIGSLPPGQYRIRTDPTIAQGYAGEYYANAILEASGMLVTVNTNTTTPNIDFHLDQGAVVEGVITGADTLLGLAGIDLDLFTSGGDLYSGADAVTSATGFYRLGPIPPGDWIVQADPTIAQGYVDEYYLNEVAISRAMTVPLAAGQLQAGVDLELDRGGLVTGNIRTRRDNQPLAGCDLDVFFTDLRRVDDHAVTNSNGNYTLGLLPPGQYIIRADPPAVFGLTEKYYYNVSTADQATPVDVMTGQTTPGIDFSLDETPSSVLNWQEYE